MIEAKQINRPQSASVRINGYAASGNSGAFTSAISTALSTAGEGGVSMPVQVLGGSNPIGVIVTGTNNLAKIYGNVWLIKFV